MLIAHASSTCDVCLESYNENYSYHAIPCGHVFCLPCLSSTNPSRCPLCRHEFSHHSMRKLHLTLPTHRDVAARNLEMKLVQSSPDMTLAEGLSLFQEVQDWLETEPQEEFLVLRAFAAVLCGFHETKDKLIHNQARAEHNEAELKRLLEEARSASISKPDGGDYKKAAKAELAVLRAECADLRSEAARQQSVYQAHYAQIQAQAQLQVQAQTEAQTASRRTSNPLPAPPRPVEIPFVKYIEAYPSAKSRSGSKGKGKEAASQTPTSIDPMSSAFVPTLSGSIPSRHNDTVDGHSEVTTLVFKPPRRVPIWDSPAISYASIETAPDGSNPGSSQPASSAGASVGVEPVPGPIAVNTTPSPEAGNSDVPRARHNADPQQAFSHLGETGCIESSHAPRSSNRAPALPRTNMSSRHDVYRYSQEVYPVSAPALQPGLDAAHGAAPVVVNPPQSPVYIKIVKRPTWQGGAGTTLRRASTPVVIGNALPPRQGLQIVTPHSSEGEEIEHRTTRTTFIRSYTTHDLLDHQRLDTHRGRSHRRPSTPSQDLHISESHSDPEPRSARLSSSPTKLVKEPVKYSRYGEHRPGHNHSHSMIAHTVSHPDGYFPSVQSRSHDDLPSYTAQPVPTMSRAPPPSRSTTGRLSSPTRHLNDTASRVVPV